MPPAILLGAILLIGLLLSCAPIVHCKLNEPTPVQNRKSKKAVQVWRKTGNSHLPKYQARFGTASVVLACFERGSHIWVDYLATNMGADTLVYDGVNRSTSIAPGQIALLVSTDLGTPPRSRDSVRVAKVQVLIPRLKSSKDINHRVEDVEFLLYR